MRGLSFSCFRLQRNRLFTSLSLGNNAGTEIRTRLRLRSTVRGANNRLDVDAIMSYDRGSNAVTPVLGKRQQYTLTPAQQVQLLHSCCTQEGRRSDAV